MMSIRKVIACLAAVAAMSWAGAAFAENITITDQSFEDTTLSDGSATVVTGTLVAGHWAASNDTGCSAAIFNPNAAAYSTASDAGTPTGAMGTNVVRLYSGSTSTTQLKSLVYQDTNAVWEVGKTYTLTAAVGKRANQTTNPIADYFGLSFKLANTSTSVLFQKTSTNVLTTDAFVDESISYTVTAADVASTGKIGGTNKKVRIMLHMYSDVDHSYGQYLDFDNVRFTVTPEPATMTLFSSALLGLAAYAWRKRR